MKTLIDSEIDIYARLGISKTEIKSISKPKFIRRKFFSKEKEILKELSRNFKTNNHESYRKLLEILKTFRELRINRNNLLIIGDYRIGKSLSLKYNFMRMRYKAEVFFDLRDYCLRYNNTEKVIKKLTAKIKKYSCIYIDETKLFSMIKESVKNNSGHDFMNRTDSNFETPTTLFLEDAFSPVNWTLNPERQTDIDIEAMLKYYFSKLIEKNIRVVSESNSHPSKIVKNEQILARLLDIFKKNNIKEIV